MKIDLEKPIKIQIEKFSAGSKKDDINPYMAKKGLIKKYQGLGYNVISGEGFETSLLIEFARKYSYLDNYIKVKLGEYKPNKKTEEYNRFILDIIGEEEMHKMLFICRICSYISDPSFPDIIVYNEKESVLRYVYNGDGLLPDKLMFILISNIMGMKEIKLSALDYLDHKWPDTIEANSMETLKKALSTLSKRVNLERSLLDTGIDFKLFEKWLEKKEINSDDIFNSYEAFMENAKRNSILKENLLKLEKTGLSSLLLDKTKPEKIKILVDRLKINMIEAHNLLNLHEIKNSKALSKL